eukprot:1136908-Pelagomonas_calceolata.AAC.4
MDQLPPEQEALQAQAEPTQEPKPASPVPEEGEDDAVLEELQAQDGATEQEGQPYYEQQQGELRDDQLGGDPVVQQQEGEEEEDKELEHHRQHPDEEGECEGEEGAQHKGSGPAAMAKATSPPQYQQQELPPVILITTVDIGGGKSDCIELRKGGDPTSAARTFCEKHSLPPHIIAPLTQHILDNLSKAKQVGHVDGRQLGQAVAVTCHRG